MRPIVAALVLLSATTVSASSAARKHVSVNGLTLAARVAVDSPADLPEPGSLGAGNSGLTISSSAAGLSDGGVHSRESDDCLRRADAHFDAGRQLYFQGSLAAARREFDQAVDVLLSAPDGVVDHNRIERRLEEMCDLIYRFDIEKLGAGQKEEEAVVFDKAPIDEISHMTFPVDQKLAPQLQSELSQTASGIPLELSNPVLGFVHYFSTESGRRTLLAGFKRSGKYKPLIQRIFAEEGVPQELIYLAQAESGFLPRAVSNKQAVGMWQFVGDTGRMYSLARSGTFDERLDPEKATRAAARFLKNLHERYGDWYLAMAAYNCGPGNVDRAVERTGYADFWELLRRHMLPRETANYVPIIVAMTIMAKNPQDYGLENIALDPPLDYDSIRLTASTHLNLIADATLQPISAIRDLNPSLLRSVAPSGFQIHVPKGSADATQAALETVPAANREAWRLHHVEVGDTLAAIAKVYHLAPERIVAVNGPADSLEAGETLLIPTRLHADAQINPLRRAAGKSARGKINASSRSTLAQRGSRVAVSRHVPIQILHRRAAIRAAGLRH